MPSRSTAETLVAEPLIICNDASSRCEDCPVINPCPPYESDCPNFELLGSEPMCTKEDATRRQIDGGNRSTGIGNIATLDLVQVIIDDLQLPGTYPTQG